MLMTKQSENKLFSMNAKTPKQTKKNKVIAIAVKKAVHDYKETFKRLAWE